MNLNELRDYCNNVLKISCYSTNGKLLNKKELIAKIKQSGGASDVPSFPSKHYWLADFENDEELQKEVSNILKTYDLGYIPDVSFVNTNEVDDYGHPIEIDFTVSIDGSDDIEQNGFLVTINSDTGELIIMGTSAAWEPFTEDLTNLFQQFVLSE